MVRQGPLQVSPAVDSLDQRPSGPSVVEDGEGLAVPRRTRGRPSGVRPLDRLPVWGERAVVGTFAAVAIMALVGCLYFATLYGASVVRISDVTAGAEAQRRLNESCQAELSFTKGELSRVDRLIGYARGK